jgi:hypothetical protein
VVAPSIDLGDVGALIGALTYSREVQLPVYLIVDSSGQLWTSNTKVNMGITWPMILRR